MQTNQNKRARPNEAVRRWLLSRRPTARPPLQLRGGLRGLLLGSAAYILSQAPLLFSVNPLAIALLCAVDGQVGFVLVGILLGLWQGGAASAPWYAASAFAAILLRCVARLYLTPPRPQDMYSPQQLRRLYFKQRLAQLKRLCYQGGNADVGDDAPTVSSKLPPLFDEPIMLRVSVCLISALIPCFGIPAAGGFAFYDLYGAAFYLLLSPTAALLFSVSLSSRPALSPPYSARAASLWRLVGVGALLASVSFCGRGLTFLALSPVVMLCVAVCLITVRQHGLGAGLFIALVCGVAYDALIIPMYACLTVIYAFLAPAIGRFALLPATLASLIYLLICGDESALLALAPSLAAGVLSYSIALRLHSHWQVLIERTGEAGRQGASPADRNRQLLMLEQAHNEQATALICAVSGAFSSLAEVLRQLHDIPATPPARELRHLCEQCFDALCPDCPHHEDCYGDGSLELLNTLHSLCRSLSDEGEVSEQCLEEGLRKRCPHKRTIIGEINLQAKRKSFEQLHNTHSEQFALCCDGISHLLRDIAHRETRSEDAHNLALSDTLAQYLNQHHIEARQTLISGENKKQLRILGLTPAAMTRSQEEFRQDMAKLLRAPVSKLHYDGADDGTFSLYTLPTLRVDYVHRALAVEQKKGNAKKRPACGDTLRVFEAQDGIFCALICDGMGHGREAAMTSGVCGVFLERLLRAGVGAQTALRMLNHYLLTRAQTPEQEVTSTVDLFMLDLYTGQGQFIKSGAAPSMILRQGRLFRLSSHTLPIGILHAVDAQYIPFEVQSGDHILLMSDGVSDAGGEADVTDDWLTDILQGAPCEDDGALLDRLFAKAREQGSCDDMSIISIRISGEQPTE